MKPLIKTRAGTLATIGATAFGIAATPALATIATVEFFASRAGDPNALPEFFIIATLAAAFATAAGAYDLARHFGLIATKRQPTDTKALPTTHRPARPVTEVYDQEADRPTTPRHLIST